MQKFDRRFTLDLFDPIGNPPPLIPMEGGCGGHAPSRDLPLPPRKRAYYEAPPLQDYRPAHLTQDTKGGFRHIAMSAISALARREQEQRHAHQLMMRQREESSINMITPSPSPPSENSYDHQAPRVLKRAPPSLTQGHAYHHGFLDGTTAAKRLMTGPPPMTRMDGLPHLEPVGVKYPHSQLTPPLETTQPRPHYQKEAEPTPAPPSHHKAVGRSRGSAPIILPCSVCGDGAPDHQHYGGVACFSCRAFFRRSVDKAHTYVCHENKSCHIDVTTRRNCQFCRYNKCLTSGMKPGWVLSEDEKRERIMKKRANAAKRQQEAAAASKGKYSDCYTSVSSD